MNMGKGRAVEIRQASRDPGASTLPNWTEAYSRGPTLGNESKKHESKKQPVAPSVRALCERPADS